MKTKFFLLVLAILIMAFGISFGQAVTLNNITGTMWHDEPDSIMTGELYTFNILFAGGPVDYRGVTNGFSVYSPDGVTWTTTVGGTLSPMRTMFDALFTIIPISVTGSGADTVGFDGVAIFGTGLPAGFFDDVYSISIGPIPAGPTHHGQTICLDSSYFPPSGLWKWVPQSLPDVFPSWDGPHCFTVVDPVALDISETVDGLPQSFALSQNYPNPFNPTTRIEFSLSTKSDVTLTIYNVGGQKVKEFTQENQSAGSHNFDWDASNVASGLYFYKLEAGEFTDTKKMMLLK